MRLVVASLKEVYVVHKTMSEFLNDNGRQRDESELYKIWPVRLTDPAFRYVLLMHARKVIGMIWGRELTGEIGKTFIIEGRYLRRAYRGRLRFSRELVTAQKEITRGFDKVLVIKRHISRKLVATRRRVIGTIEELR